MSEPLVSIIMPAHNVEQYIDEAIRSVLNQQYKNWELIVIENASSDNTTSVARSFVDARIHFIQIGSKGLSNARNIGLQKAKGEFICFLDADDRLPPTSINSRIQLLQQDEDLMFADGGMEQYDHHFKNLQHVWTPNFVGNPLNEMMLLDPNCFCGLTWMIRRKNAVELRFDTSWTHLEDRIFLLSIAPFGKYHFVNEVTYQIRRRPGSLMTKLKALENGYQRYLHHVHSLNVLTHDVKRKEILAFHRLFFRTYLKKARLFAAIRHGLFIITHPA